MTTKVECLFWVETAISAFLIAAAEIGNADHLVIKLPAAAVAENRPLTRSLA